MASDSEQTWKDRFADARFSAEEATEWERLVAQGEDRDSATRALLAAREK